MALRGYAIGLVVCAAVLLPRFAAGQAWPAPAGAGSVSFTTQRIDNTGHVMTDGFLLRDGKSRTVSGLVDVDYAVTDRLSLSVGIPFVYSRFLGPGPSLANLPVDACRCWNAAWQDWGATVRYTVLDGPVALTPSVSLGLPSHDYQWEGEAVAGYGLRELRLALDGGVQLDAISSRLALISRYQYAAVEDVLDVPNNRSNGFVAVSYAVSPRLSMRAGVAWQRTHGGLRFGTLSGAGPAPPFEAGTPERFREHDRLLSNHFAHLTLGASYSLPGADLFAAFQHFTWSRDSHAGRAVSAGVSVPFQR